MLEPITPTIGLGRKNISTPEDKDAPRKIRRVQTAFEQLPEAISNKLGNNLSKKAAVDIMEGRDRTLGSETTITLEPSA